MASFTGTLKHSIDTTAMALKDPLVSGPICKICPFLIVPLMTVPARMIFPSTTYLSEIEYSVLISSLFLISLTLVNKLKKLVSRSIFLPVTLDIRNIGMTSSVEVIR